MSTAVRTSKSTSISGADFVAQATAAITKIRNDVMAEVGQAMDEALQAGEDAAHTRIETAVTETGRNRALDGLGQEGRIDTGAMWDGFQHHSYQVNPDHMQGRIGWIDGADNANSTAVPFKIKSYVELQENGFVANGTAVPAVHALLDGTEVAKARFKKALTDYVKREFK